MLDLHTHSTASDGSLTPEGLARAGRAAGLDIMALTDHDGVGGVHAFLKEAQAIGLKGVPGIELSAEVPHGQLHLVGLGINPDHAELKAYSEKLLNGRAERNLAIFDAFHEQGIALEEAEVRAFAGEDVVSRVHFAQALIARGLARDVADAFARFLGKGACCYRERFRYSPESCIQMIHSAGGVAVMAHPLSLEQEPAKLERAIASLKALGLEAMECFYSAYDTETSMMLLRLARRLDLLPSVGSDFHGAPKPTVHLGRLTVSPETEALWRERLRLN